MDRLSQSAKPSQIPEQKHPKALAPLFLTEMWERFGFYTAQGLLVLYMTGFFRFTDEKSFVISGLFAGLAYIAGVVGGYIADKILGFKTTIIWGGFILTLGYACLGFSFYHHLFYLSLAIIIVGNGLLKPNISSLLGSQYTTTGALRDAGFTIFYMGINIGAALSGLSGYIRDYFGWHTPFFIASLGMLIGMIIFLSNLKYMKTAPPKKTQHIPGSRGQAAGRRPLLFLFLLFCVAIITTLFHYATNAEWILPTLGIVIILYLIKLTLGLTPAQRNNMLLLITLILFSIIFWMLFYQMFIAANLYVERLVDKHVGGFKLSTTLFYASEGIFIIILAPFFAWLWHALDRKHYDISTITKFAGGLFFLGLGFVVLTLSTLYPNELDLINPLWVFSAYFLITIGEILLSPIGLSAVTILAPEGLVGFMMGTWFVAIGFGGFFAGMIATIAAIPENMTDVSHKLVIYHHAFLIYALIALVFALALFLLSLALPTKQRL